jgi:hypothetical protein
VYLYRSESCSVTATPQKLSAIEPTLIPDDLGARWLLVQIESSGASDNLRWVESGGTLAKSAAVHAPDTVEMWGPFSAGDLESTLLGSDDAGGETVRISTWVATMRPRM